MNKTYGKELVLDIHNCDLKTMTKESLDQFLVELCDLIGMERVKVHYWIEDEGMSREEYESNPHLQGISVCQFIKTSSIVIHAITGLKNVYLNIFSCKNFDTSLAEGFALSWFDGTKANCVVMDRN